MYDSVEDCDEPNADPPKAPKPPLVGSRPLLACDLNVFLLIFAGLWGPVYWIVVVVVVVVSRRARFAGLMRTKILCLVVYVRRDSHAILFTEGAAKDKCFYEKYIAVVRTRLTPKDSLPPIRDVVCDGGVSE